MPEAIGPLGDPRALASLESQRAEFGMSQCTAQISLSSSSLSAGGDIMQLAALAAQIACNPGSLGLAVLSQALRPITDFLGTVQGSIDGVLSETRGFYQHLDSVLTMRETLHLGPVNISASLHSSVPGASAPGWGTGTKYGVAYAAPFDSQIQFGVQLPDVVKNFRTAFDATKESYHAEIVRLKAAKNQMLHAIEQAHSDATSFEQKVRTGKDAVSNVLSTAKTLANVKCAIAYALAFSLVGVVTAGIIGAGGQLMATILAAINKMMSELVNAEQCIAHMRGALSYSQATAKRWETVLGI